MEVSRELDFMALHQEIWRARDLRAETEDLINQSQDLLNRCYDLVIQQEGSEDGID